MLRLDPPNFTISSFDARFLSENGDDRTGRSRDVSCLVRLAVADGLDTVVTPVKMTTHSPALPN